MMRDVLCEECKDDQGIAQWYVVGQGEDDDRCDLGNTDATHEDNIHNHSGHRVCEEWEERLEESYFDIMCTWKMSTRVRR